MKINVLPAEIANMIAAGEVVERPASVVKELAENSIDAGATNVTIEIKKGGMTFIRISDNGCGISADQVTTAFLRHATSKIATGDDLNSIYTLGFRGEALASIAAVSGIDIFTKPKEQSFGFTASIVGGEVTDQSEAGCPDGTTITVRDLFFNTPARMKFLKNDATETSYVTDVVNKLILSHPEISFRFINNGKTVVQSPGDGKLISAIYTVFGKDYVRHMTEIAYSDDCITVEGYAGNSAIARRDRRHQVFYINGRNITSRLLSAACGEAYQNSLMTGKFPVVVLNIRLNTNLVDVNVHPTKMEVRFSDDKKIYSAVYWAVKNALSGEKYVPEIKISQTEPQKKVMVAPAYDIPEKQQREQINMLRDAYINTAVKQQPNTQTVFEPTEQKAAAKPASSQKIEADNSRLEKEQSPAAITFEQQKPVYDAEPPKVCQKPVAAPEQPEVQTEDDEEFTGRFAKVQDVPVGNPPVEQETQPEISKTAEQSYRANIDFKIIGQIFGTYIIVQMDNDMLLIDQHAAHERIYFESFMEDWKNKSFSPQILLIPITMDFAPTDFEVVISNRQIFEELGFDIDVFGERSIIIRQIPYADDEAVVEETVSEIAQLLLGNAVDIKANIINEALHTMACKRAVKGNRELSMPEMESLVERVLAMTDINTCPHGRPIMTKMSKYSLEKQFKRIV
ncbi:MAG: DNA mismatch repair endonuclease MutL [Clostridia bacterium]|nr:DNA mismatch repair endonuclease MutL [Clostridia bacterium]